MSIGVVVGRTKLVRSVKKLIVVLLSPVAEETSGGGDSNNTGPDSGTTDAPLSPGSARSTTAVQIRSAKTEVATARPRSGETVTAPLGRYLWVTLNPLH